MTLLFSLPILALSLLAQEPAKPAPEAGAAGLVQRLRVIIEDEAGKRVPEARIFFMISELTRLDLQRMPRVLEYRADKRGRAIIPLDTGHDWVAWAAKSSGKKRWASELSRKVLEKGILRLTLKPFPVPFLRISKLAPWKALFPGKLSLVYVSSVSPHPRFRGDIPAGEDEVRELPPLPLENYFPILWHEDWGLLDTIYLGPAFNEGDRGVEQLYERDYPLKKFILGKPLRLSGEITGRDGKGVAGAELRCGPDRNKYPCPLRQVVTTDAKGRYELWLGFKPKGQRTSYMSEVVVWAPGSRPAHYSLVDVAERFEKSLQGDAERARRGITRDFVLTPARSLDWRYPGAKEGDEFFLLTRVLQAGSQGRFLGMEIRRNGEEQLFLPGVPLVKGIGLTAEMRKAAPGNRVTFEIYLRRGGRLLALSGRENGVLVPKLRMGLSKMGSLELRASSQSGRVLKRGSCQVKRVFSDRLAQVATSFGLEPDGSTSLRLPAGTYVLRFSQSPQGEGYASFEVRTGETTKVEIKVEPFVRLRGKLVCDDEEVDLAGAQITVYSRVIRKTGLSPMARAWIIEGLQQSSSLKGQGGSFEVFVSPFVEKVNLQAYLSIKDRHFSAQAQINPRETQQVELTFR